MNREILFRGKRIDNGEWIIGDLTTYTDTRGQKTYEILDKTNLIDIYIPSVLGDLPTQMPAFINVDENSVGQYTGLCDKNGTKIFEGDILDVWENEKHKQSVVVIFEKGSFTVSHYALNLLCERNLYSEVVGNIHDNPELL